MASTEGVLSQTKVNEDTKAKSQLLWIWTDYIS